MVRIRYLAPLLLAGCATFAQDAEHRPRVLAELADVTIGVLLLADRLGVSLPEIVAEKIERNARKYPVDDSRGRAS